jgi:aspartate aminotransferase
MENSVMTLEHRFSQRAQASGEAFSSVLRFLAQIEAQSGNPNVSDFAFGNPHDMPLQGFVNAMQSWSAPQNKDWYAYKMSEEPARKTVAETLRKWRGIPFEADDILMTNGAFGALAVAIDALVDTGDEMMFMSPPWFFYEALIVAKGGTPVRVKIDTETFDLDLAAIEAAITSKTKAILVNSPNNPTGKIYPAETLQKLAAILSAASERYGHTIYLISDEAYSRIIFDGAEFYSPTAYYPNTFLIYTYGKTLLTPGQRIGWIALTPTMPDRQRAREALMTAQIMNGWAFPNALLQHALGDLEKLSIDMEHLQEKRDKMVGALRDIGYDVHSPEGTFYLLPRSPLADDWAFSQILIDHDILCLPGTVVELPGYFRLSLTANDDMIERAIPNFAKAFEQAKARV